MKFVRGFVLSALAMVGRGILGLLILIKPIVWIRIGMLNSNRIGSLLSSHDYALRSEALRGSAHPETKRPVDIFVSAPHTEANPFVVDMIARRRNVIRSRLANSIYFATRVLWPKHPALIPPYDTAFDDHEVWQNTRPMLLSFTAEEKARGEVLLRSLGIPEDAPFICFAIRDSAYLERTEPTNPGGWAYQDYRDGDVETCRPMAEYFANKGYWVLRMGAVVKNPITWNHPRIIDYATRFRSDFGDVFLLGNCRFFLGDSAGIQLLSNAFNVPVAMVNLVPLYLPCRSTITLASPKKLRSVTDGRVIGLAEMIARGFDNFMFTDQFIQAKLELINSTPEEILEIGKEIEARATGTWVSSAEDEELQQRFKELIPPGHHNYGSNARLSAAFLRRNRELLKTSDTARSVVAE